MSNRLFVGNLSFNATSDGLRTAFSAHGDVTDAAVITDRETGRSRGFGFVTMSTPAAAQAAITALNGASLDGRSLRVNEAEARSAGARGGSPRGW